MRSIVPEHILRRCEACDSFLDLHAFPEPNSTPIQAMPVLAQQNKTTPVLASPSASADPNNNACPRMRSPPLQLARDNACPREEEECSRANGACPGVTPGKLPYMQCLSHLRRPKQPF